MKAAAWFALLLLLPSGLPAQTSRVERGAGVFQKSCAVAYCHGPAGGAGRAPQLAGHRMAENVLLAVVSAGIPRTSMPGFSKQLSAADLDAVVGYVMSLRGTEPEAGATGSGAAARLMAPAVKKGKDLFFDAARLGACNSCHELEGRGIAVGPDLRGKVTGGLGNLAHAPAPHVVTVRDADGDTFVGLALPGDTARLRVYDLTARLPVLRTFGGGTARVAPGGAWSHERATQLYSAAELESIAEYLRWVK